jgi:hypothetical protein
VLCRLLQVFQYVPITYFCLDWRLLICQ